MEMNIKIFTDGNQVLELNGHPVRTKRIPKAFPHWEDFGTPEGLAIGIAVGVTNKVPETYSSTYRNKDHIQDVLELRLPEEFGTVVLELDIDLEVEEVSKRVLQGV